MLSLVVLLLVLVPLVPTYSSFCQCLCCCCCVRCCFFVAAYFVGSFVNTAFEFFMLLSLQAAQLDFVLCVFVFSGAKTLYISACLVA